MVEMLEAVYAQDLDDAAWLGGILRAARPALEQGHGISGYLYDASCVPVSLWGYTQLGDGLSATELAEAMATADEAYVSNSWRSKPCGTASEVPGFEEQPALRYLHTHGIRDVLAINGFDPSGVGCWIGANLSAVRRLSHGERVVWSKISAHLAAGLRLRRRLAASGPRAISEAVISPVGRVEHAEGEAATSSAREALRRATRTLEGVRSRRIARGEVLTLWTPLVRTRWSLVDRFEQDGRRYVVACINAPNADGSEALTPRERQVLSCAAVGHDNKLIAYELGISASTVRVLLTRASVKLGVHTREQAISAFLASQQGDGAH